MSNPDQLQTELNNLDQAKALYQQGKLSEALQLYLEILNEDPQQADIIHMIANTHIRMQQPEQALSYIEKAIALQPRNAIFYNTLGRVYAASNKNDENQKTAESTYQKALEIDPKCIETYNNLAWLYFSQNKLDDATALLRKALEINPHHYPSLYYLGQLLLNNQQPKEAVKYFNQCINQDPRGVELNHKLGLAFFHTKQYENAIHYFRITLMLDLEHIDANYNLANAFLQINKTELSLNYFLKQLEIKPSLECHMNIGLLYVDLKEYSDAEKHFLQALEFDPHDLSAHLNLGSLHLKFDHTHKALHHYQEVIKLEPDNLPVHLNLGGLYRKLSDYDSAIRHFKEAQRIDPNDITAKFVLSALCQKDCPDETPREFTSELFNQYAPHFEKHLCESLEYVAPQLLHQAVLEKLGEQNQLDVLDLGCGTGLCGSLFAPIAKTLIGIDLSEDMITEAKNKKTYSLLKVSDINEALTEFHDMDVILAADVFVYIGNLDKIFENVYKSLKPGGLFAFTVEKGSKHDYILQKNTRYAHSNKYIERLSKDNHLNILRLNEAVLRKEGETPVKGNLVILQK
ncbi:MAG: tetratricopeptide repeat protein [Gammaproteobacteria bacterium]|nr:tetratricopeptide repeat protein [Gammaproteobacteria bacterium]